MLNVNHVTFSYQKTPILKDLSFQVEQGAHLAIIGESGSGKSTLLKLLHGAYDLDFGTINWKEHDILGPKFNLVVGYDFMKYVAQEFDLMPFISVEENIGKFLSNFYPEEKKQRIAELLEVIELAPLAKRKVKTLSGGQKQRVALARALAKHPEIILLDEPFSHIDNFKKQSLRRRVFKYLKDKHITCIVATHDREDVLGFADLLLVLHNKKINAYDTPKNLYNNPKTSLVAAFFGEFNIINNTIVYAHQLKIAEHAPLQVTIITSYFKGHYYLIEAELKGESIFFESDTLYNNKDVVNLNILE